MLKIAMISTGEEVLYGDIVDTNAAWLSRVFYQHGFAITHRSTIGDNVEAIQQEIAHLSHGYDIVIVNGGLGPTTDDLSTTAAAKAAGVGLILSPLWLERMQLRYRELGREMPESNLKQAMLPEGANLVDNPIGTACGYYMTLNRATLFFTPGVPKEFKMMVEDQIIPRLQQWNENIEARECSRLFTFGLSESGINDQLAEIQLPSDYEIGYRSSLPFIEVKLFGPKGDDVRISILESMYSKLSENVVSVNEPMLDNTAELLSDLALKITIAEQATGGWLTNWVHENEKFRAALKQGWILSTQVEQNLADQDPLAAALALAAATRERTQTDIGLSSGLIIDGEVAVALSTEYGEWGQLVSLRRDYDYNDMRSVVSALMLDMLRRCLERKPLFGQYESIKRLSEIYVPPTEI